MDIFIYNCALFSYYLTDFLRHSALNWTSQGSSFFKTKTVCVKKFFLNISCKEELKWKSYSSQMSNNIFNNFWFFPWNPYFKTDGTNLFFLFSIKETKQYSMKILWNDSIKYLIEVMLDIWLMIWDKTVQSRKSFMLCISSIQEAKGYFLYSCHALHSRW